MSFDPTKPCRTKSGLPARFLGRKEKVLQWRVTIYKAKDKVILDIEDFLWPKGVHGTSHEQVCRCLDDAIAEIKSKEAKKRHIKQPSPPRAYPVDPWVKVLMPL